MLHNLLADLETASRVMATVKQAGKKLSANETKSIGSVIDATKLSFASKIEANTQALSKAIQQRVAIFKSAKEGLLTEDAGKKELASVRAKISELQATKAKLDKGITALNNMADLQKELTAASPRLEQLEKGHESDAQIKEPEQAPAAPAQKVTESSKKVRANSLITQAIKLHELAGKEKDTKKKAMIERKAILFEKMADKLVPEIADNIKEVAKEIGNEVAKAIEKEVVSPTKEAPKLEAKEPAKAEASKKTSDKLAPEVAKEVKEIGKDLGKEVAKEVVKDLKAVEPGKETPAQEAKETPAHEAKETPAEEKKEHELPKAEDKMAARRQAFKAYLAKKKASIQASIEVKANDKVVLPDGSVGAVASINGDKVMVTIGGVEKEYLASTIKRMGAETAIPVFKEEVKSDVVDKGGTQKEKSDVVSKAGSLADKVKEAVSIMRNGGKKVADVAPATSPDAPKETKEKLAPNSGDVTVKSETNLIGVNPESGKFTVTTVNNETKEFDTEEAAKAFIGKVGAKFVRKSIYTYQSESDKEPDANENISSKLKGLDQSGKDYGTTAKEEKVNPSMSVAKASKVVATTTTKDSPVDSATTKAPDSSESISSKLKGLDQNSKGYSSTTGEEKVNPQLSIYAQKIQILSGHNKKMAGELAKFKAKDLVARALKVGAISEAQSEEQMTVLAELHTNSPAEFNAFERLIANMESQVTTASIAERPIRKVQASMTNRGQVLVDASEGSEASGSLENGTFFDDN
jgi:hypothetical protein